MVVHAIDRARRLGPLLRLLAMLALFVAALRLLEQTLRHYSYRQVMAYVEALPPGQVILAIALTVASYFVMTGYDLLAFRYIGEPLPYRRVALAAFIGYAFNNNIGLSGLVGGSIRYRLYSAWRLSAVKIAKVIAFYTITLWLGFAVLGGMLFIAVPIALPRSIHLPVDSVRAAGFALLIPAIGYVASIAIRKKPVRIRQWEFELPAPQLIAAQLLVSAVDWMLAAATLYVLLPPELPLGYAPFLGIFLLAQMGGIASNLPGGVGVFEAVILLFLAPYHHASEIVGALVAFRAAYYLMPLAAATVLLAAREIAEKREGAVRVARLFGRWAPGIAPHLLAFTTFLGGAVLLFSGATPALAERVTWLRLIVPLPIVELSHFLGSIAGVALMLLARGLQRRLDSAYQLTVIVLGASIGFQIFKGADFEEAAILAVMLLGVLSARKHFYRRGSLANATFGPGWITAIALVLIGSGWLGFFSYKHVDYSHELWWEFSFRGDAPRFLRASVGVVGALLILGFRRLLAPPRARATVPTEDEREMARSIVATEHSSESNLALLGDKSFLFSDSRRALIMYGVEGRSWIAMGDPVGAAEEKADLIWRFREICDVASGWPVFYEVKRANLHLYLDAGLTLLKIGEEARVPLSDFSLEGGSRKWMRKMLRRIEDERCSFDIVAAADVGPLMPELRAISDRWLSEKRTREKGFSVGFFDEAYVANFRVAVVRREGRPVAFANLWESAEREELSVDLMRHVPDAPSGVMDYIFVELMRAGAAEGYRWFNLGMAPLSGLETRSVAPLWNRVGALTYRFGENFYNFQGLRQYKEKFDPLWEPTYIASPGGLALPRILTNVASLISGGVRGVVSK